MNPPGSSCRDSDAILQPTYYGHVATKQDALALFKACLSGQLYLASPLARDLERSDFIQSGRVFIYEENESDVQQWRDGLQWSPIWGHDSFLFCKELETLKRGESSAGPLRHIPPHYKQRGFVRKTMSLEAGRMHLHLVSYYKEEDVENGTLKTPS